MQLAWQTVNEASRRKSTSTGEIKDFRSEKNMSKMCLETPPEITDKPAEEILKDNFEHFTESEFDIVLERK